jgi:hypothetical protein
MKIEDLLVNEQVDEGIGSAIGKGLGAVGKGIGAVASVPQGIGRAIKKGYQGGVATIAGDPNPTTATPAGAGAQGNVPQATRAQQPQGAVSTGVGNIGSSLANITGFGGGASTGAASAGDDAVAPAGGTTSATGGTTAVSPLQDKKFMGTLQALKGNDIETVRRVLQSRAAVAEGLDEGVWDTTKDALSKAGHVASAAGRYGADKAVQGAKWAKDKTVQGANWTKDKAVQGAKWTADKAVQGARAAGQAIANAPDTLGTVAGKVGASGTRFSQAYQNARGGYMTIQDLQRSIAAMSPKDAGEALQFFNSIHPDTAAPAGADASTGAGELKVVDGGKAPTGTEQSFGSRGIAGMGEGIDELASMKNMLDILKRR